MCRRLGSEERLSSPFERSHPSHASSTHPSIHLGPAVARTTRGGVHFKGSLCVGVSRNESSTTSSKSTEVFGFTRRVEKHRSALVVEHQSPGPERRRFICWSCSPVRLIRVYTPLFLYFDSCCGQSYRLFSILAYPL